MYYDKPIRLISHSRDIFFAFAGVTTIIYILIISAIMDVRVFPARGTGSTRLFSHFPPPITPHKIVNVDLDKPIAIVGDIHGERVTKSRMQNYILMYSRLYKTQNFRCIFRISVLLNLIKGFFLAWVKKNFLHF